MELYVMINIHSGTRNADFFATSALGWLLPCGAHANSGAVKS